MKIPDKKMSRREMLKLAGLAGIAGALGVPRFVSADGDTPPSHPALPQVPRRTLGKTNEKVPILLMGMAMNFDQKFDPKLAEALRFGVNYFDCADCYEGGRSETAAGNFLEQSGKRKEVWITTKSCNHTPDGMVKVLETSLQRLKTDHVDLFFLHGLQNPQFLSADMGKMADKLKKDGKIRFFGFSCHDSTVAVLLDKAAGLAWIDAIMFKYNFRDFGNKEINSAMDACHKSNVGLIAMKTQGSAVSFEDKVKKFDSTKWSRQQAVLKAVWEDERITAAVSHMDSLDKIKQNVAAAIDPTKLTGDERQSLQEYALATQNLYCRGCDHICGRALPEGLQVGTTLRYLMYHDSYGNTQNARELFAELPDKAKRIDGVDFREASALCPHGIDIAKHMQRASEVLA